MAQGYGSFAPQQQQQQSMYPGAPFGSIPAGGPEDGRPMSSEHSLLRSGGGNGAPRSKVNIWELILVPWVLLAIILICFLQAGAHGYNAVLFVIPIVLIALCAGFLRYHYQQQDNPEVVLGILCLTAIIISLAVGCLGVRGSLLEYHRLSQGASYFNVLASERAAGKSDATTLVFTNQTKVDMYRTFGWTDINTRHGHTYCVAPVSAGAPYETHIQFWAAGVDCCEARANFACGDALRAVVHGALVWPETSPYLSGFREAVAGAQALYGVTADPGFMMLKWHGDPVGHRNGLFKQTLTLFLVFGGVYLVISAMIGFAVMPVFAGK